MPEVSLLQHLLHPLSAFGRGSWPMRTWSSRVTPGRLVVKRAWLRFRSELPAGLPSPEDRAGAQPGFFFASKTKGGESRQTNRGRLRGTVKVS